MTITMYGADWCGDCRRAKAWFAANDIAYDYVDLVADPDETERVLERNGGVKKIPVIVFSDDSHLVEPSNADLAAKMAELDAAPASATPANGADGGTGVTENVDDGRFELHIDGELVSFASYQAGDSDAGRRNVVVPHVETLIAHRGNGYAAKLMDGMLDLLRTQERTITPLCPFAAGHVRDNPAHHDLLP